MVDFRKLISPKSRREVAQRTAAVHEYHKLPDTGKAEVLLTHARALIDSGVFSSDQRYSYDEWALYRVIPEIALRLDPGVTLRETEQPKDEESTDRVTWLRGAGVEKLQSAVSSIQANGSFRRALRPDAPKGLPETFDLLFGFEPNIFSVAASAAISGHSIWKEEPETRPALPGTYLIASMASGRDQVLRYCEDDAEINVLFSQSLAICRGEEIDEDEASGGHLTDRIRERLFTGIRLNTIESVSLQSFDGDILKIEEVTSKHEDLEPGL